MKPALPDAVPAEVVAAAIKRHRMELHRELAELGSMSDAGKLAAVVAELAVQKAWEEINAKQHLELVKVLMDVKVECYQCEQKIDLLDAMWFGEGLFFCRGCAAKVVASTEAAVA